MERETLRGKGKINPKITQIRRKGSPKEPEDWRRKNLMVRPSSGNQTGRNKSENSWSKRKRLRKKAPDERREENRRLGKRRTHLLSENE